MLHSHGRADDAGRAAVRHCSLRPSGKVKLVTAPDTAAATGGDAISTIAIVNCRACALPKISDIEAPQDRLAMLDHFILETQVIIPRLFGKAGAE
ncbi:MAG TPA: hypothetical protein PK808_06110 [Polymorphobacter sp.]|nr:hypothetical protein [Polymorphobacter sp.]